MLAYLPEFLGAMLMILLGDGVVANTTLNKSGMKGAGSIQITLGWGLAMMIPVFIFGDAYGTYFNPAVTLALAIDGSLAWNQVLGCVLAQFAGAFVGAILVFMMFRDQFDATEDPGTKLGVFSTGPAIPNIPRNVFCEAVATFVLVFAIKGVPGAAPAGVGNLLVFGIIVSIGMSLGGLTGYALNPARDIGPRIAHAFLPIKGKGSSNWGYAIVPLVGPVIGAIAAVLLYGVIPW